MDTIIEPLEKSQLPKVLALLNEAGLPSKDAAEHWQNFLVASNNKELVGAVGVELYGRHGFVRSLVVKPALRNHGLGKQLYAAAAMLARSKGVSELGLLTNTAENFFVREGFRKIEKESIPEFIKGTKEYTTFCPSSAVAMVKVLE